MPRDFDDWGQGDEFGQETDGAGTNVRTGSGGWHWLLTLVSIAVVTLFSMGMAWLTKDVDERPVWMMGMIFMVPTGALMLATMFVEGATSAMTPQTSRGPQIRLAIIVTIATFLVGCICDLIYLQGFRKELAPAQSSVLPVQRNEQIFLIWDDTASMNENGKHEAAVSTAGKLFDFIPEGTQVAMASGDQVIPFASWDSGLRQKINGLIQTKPVRGRMYFQEELEKALLMIRDQGSREKTRIVFFSDGRHAWSNDGSHDLQTVLLKQPVSIYWITFDSVPEEISNLAAPQRECSLVAPGDIQKVLDGITLNGYQETVAPAEVQKDLRLQLDLVRNRDPSAIVITAVMMILEGLSLGICLSLMFSVSGQFRVQYLISPLMGALSFVLLKYVMSTENMATWWIREGLCFSLLGIVFMTKNRFGRHSSRTGQMTNVNENW